MSTKNNWVLVEGDGGVPMIGPEGQPPRETYYVLTAGPSSPEWTEQTAQTVLQHVLRVLASNTSVFDVSVRADRFSTGLLGPWSVLVHLGIETETYSQYIGIRDRIRMGLRSIQVGDDNESS